MKRTRAQQPKAEAEPQDPAAATTKPQQRRAKQPRQPKAGGKTKAAGAGTRVAAAAATSVAAAAATAANAASAASSPGPETAAPTVPDVVCGHGDAGADAGTRTVDCWDLDAGAAAAWWTWGVDEEKLLGWFPFVEEDFPSCVAGRAADAEVAAFDDDIWSIW